MSNKVFLIPSLLSEEIGVLSTSVISVIKHTDVFFVENIRTARRFISALKTGRVIEELQFYLVDKKTSRSTVAQYFKEVGDRNIGVISEAGCPGIADPGNVVVKHAHENGIQIVPLAGPSSIFMALMASGLNGQSFTFNGYIPIEKKDRIKRLKELEQIAMDTGYSQIFMETPYRNDQLLEDLLKVINPNIMLCIACDITSQNELILTQSISDWKKLKISFHKRPTIFIMNRE